MGFDRLRFACALIVALPSAACTRTAAPPLAPAATVENRQPESALTTVRLTPSSEARLAVETVAVIARDVRAERSMGGDITTPPGRVVTMSAPLPGTIRRPSTNAIPSLGAPIAKGTPIIELVPIAPVDRDTRAQAERLVVAAESRFHMLESQAERAQRLLAERAASTRALEEAINQRDLGRADLLAAKERLKQVEAAPMSADVVIVLRAPRAGVLRQLYVSPGQTIAAGAPLFELVDASQLWVRVPVFVDDLRSIDGDAPARVHLFGADDGRESFTARPIQSPPSADSLNATVDLYYQLDAGVSPLRPGQRVGVTLAMKSAKTVSVVPWSSIVYDYEGGAWVYERTQPRTYVRRRVAVDRVTDPWAALARGPTQGALVVSHGAAELFGIEFGAGH